MHLDGDSFATVAVVFVAVAAFAVASSDENVAVFPYDAFVAVGDDAFHRFHVDAVAVVAVLRSRHHMGGLTLMPIATCRYCSADDLANGSPLDLDHSPYRRLRVMVGSGSCSFAAAATSRLRF